MLILNASNITEGGLQKEGLSDYEVWIGINAHEIWSGEIKGHVRAEGAAKLLRLIADQIDAHSHDQLGRTK